MRLYSKKISAKDAARQFVERVRRVIPEAQRVTKRKMLKNQDTHINIGELHQNLLHLNLSND
eukprot:12938635-Ditylum_brightwellii.AAC.1